MHFIYIYATNLKELVIKYIFGDFSKLLRWLVPPGTRGGSWVKSQLTLCYPFLLFSFLIIFSSPIPDFFHVFIFLLLPHLIFSFDPIYFQKILPSSQFIFCFFFLLSYFPYNFPAFIVLHILK